MSAASPDADLISMCHQFAETAFRNWYLYVIRPAQGPGSADELDVDDDWDTLARIEETPATTPEGFVAKALACAAWSRRTYDAEPEGCDGDTVVLSSLLRDMAAPARRKILAALEVELGPLPDGYDSEWRWIGRSAPEVVQQLAPDPAMRDRELLMLGCALDAAWKAQIAYFERPEIKTDEQVGLGVAPCSALVDRILHLKATTFGGLCVKARAVKWCVGDEESKRSGDDALRRDLTL